MLLDDLAQLDRTVNQINMVTLSEEMNVVADRLLTCIDLCSPRSGIAPLWRARGPLGH